MKITRLLAGVVVAGFAISSCQDDAPVASVDQLSSFAKSYVGMQFGSSSLQSASFSNASGNIANESFNRLYNHAGNSGGRKGEDSDTVIYENPWEWQSCATITTTQNEDESTTTAYDYGDGCFEGYEGYKQWTFGRYAYTNKYSSEKSGSVYTDDYMYKYVANNYGSRYYYAEDSSSWNNDGYTNYEGSSIYDEENQSYEGHYAYEVNSTYTWNDQSYSSVGHGITTYNDKKSVVEERDMEYTNSEDYYYRSTVLTPLVIRWTCNTSWASNSIGIDQGYCWLPTYVAGRELIRYKQDGVEGSFIIDYGNGECDSDITIIENDLTIRLDLSNQAVVKQFM